MDKPDLGRVFTFGTRLLRACPGWVVLYLFLTLGSQTLVPIGVSLTFSKLEATVKPQGQVAVPGEAAETGAMEMGGQPGNPSLVGLYFFWLALLVAQLVLKYFASVVAQLTDARVWAELRQSLFRQIMNQPPSFFHAYDSGRLNLILNQYVIQAQLALRQLTLDPVLNGVGLAISGYVLIGQLSQLRSDTGSIFWIIIVGIAVVALLSPWLVSKFGGSLQRAVSALQERNLALSSLTDGAIKSPEEIQAFNSQCFFSGKHDSGVESIFRGRMGQTRTLEMVNAANSFPTFLITALLIGAAVFIVVTGGTATSTGAFLAIYLLVPSFMSPIQALSGYMISLRQSWPSIRLLTEILDQAETSRIPEGKASPPKMPPTLEARDVVFRYQPDAPLVFNGLNFTCRPESITGFVARMGAGKTTFFRLAMRFFDPQEGTVLVGGLPAADYRLDSLRTHTTMMSQFPAFFRDTLRENFLAARPDASDAEIQAVCEKTGLWNLLLDRVGPNPLEARFSSDSMLSGGQKKLFALTRCLLRNPAMLYLDEPTAGMDNTEKYGLIPVMRRALEGKTVMVVDHDINWLMEFCDQFIVIDRGRVAQTGEGAALSRQPGLFRELWELSNRARADAAHAPIPPPAPPPPPGADLPAGQIGGAPPENSMQAPPPDSLDSRNESSSP